MAKDKMVKEAIRDRKRTAKIIDEWEKDKADSK